MNNLEEFVEELKSNPSLGYLTSKANPSLETLQLKCDNLLTFIKTEKTAIELKNKIDSLESSVYSLQKAINENTNQLMQINKELSEQKEQLFLYTQDYSQLIKRVHGVLDSLDDYLRRHS